MNKKIFILVLLAIAVQAAVFAQQVLDVNISALLWEIENNEARANQLYQNKTLRISGVATNISNDSLWLAVSSSEYWNSILVFFNSTEKSKLLSLNQYQRITIRGVYDGSQVTSCIRRAVIETAPQQSQNSSQSPTPQPRQAQPQQGIIFLERDTPIEYGNDYYRKGDYDRAIAEYNRAIRADPNYIIAYIHRGNAYYNKGDYDRAIADYNQAIRLDPNFIAAYHNRGNAYDEKGDYDKAIADYNQVLRLGANNAVIYNDRGAVYYDKGDYDRAIADFTEALRLDPNNAQYKSNLETARKKRGR